MSRCESATHFRKGAVSRTRLRRSQDRAFVGNIVLAMEAYARGDLGAPLVDLGEANGE